MSAIDGADQTSGPGPWLRRLLWVSVALVLSVNAALIVASALAAPFGHDEFQHSHIAWNVLNGQVPYRDFFEHHGIIFPAITGLALRIVGGDASFGTLTLLRFVSLAGLPLLMHATYLLARRLELPSVVAVAAPALLAAAELVHLNAIEVRPDTWQNVFWVYGLAALLTYAPRGFMIAGACFALASFANVKAGVGVTAAVVLGVVGLATVVRPGSVARRFGWLTLGAAVPTVLIISSLAWLGALQEFVRYNFAFNAEAASAAPSLGLFRQYYYRFYAVETPLAGLTLLGAVGLAIWAVRSRRQRAHVAVAVVVGSAALLTWVGARAELYRQFYMCVLPLLAVVAVAGTFHLADASAALIRRRLGPMFLTRGDLRTAGVVLGVCLAGLILASQRYEAFRGLDRDRRAAQRERTEMILATTTRETPIGFLWNDCGGFVFNADVQYHWARIDDLAEVGHFRRFEGFDPFDRPWVAALERQRVPWIVATEVEIDMLPARARDYVERTFIRRSSCLLSRRGSDGAWKRARAGRPGQLPGHVSTAWTLQPVALGGRWAPAPVRP